VNRFLSLAVTLVLILTFAGCGAREAEPSHPEPPAVTAPDIDTPTTSPDEPAENTPPAETSESVQTGLFAEQILSGADGDIHYSYYLPDSYDGSRKFPMMVVMPGYNMMWFGEDSSGSNLNWSGFMKTPVGAIQTSTKFCVSKHPTTPSSTKRAFITITAEPMWSLTTRTI